MSPSSLPRPRRGDPSSDSLSTARADACNPSGALPRPPPVPSARDPDQRLVLRGTVRPASYLNLEAVCRRRNLHRPSFVIGAGLLRWWCGQRSLRGVRWRSAGGRGCRRWRGDGRRVGAGVNHQARARRGRQRASICVDIHECHRRPSRALGVPVARPGALALGVRLKESVGAHPAGLFLQALQRDLIVFTKGPQPRRRRVSRDAADHHVWERRHALKDHIQVTAHWTRGELQCRGRSEGVVHAPRAQRSREY